MKPKTSENDPGEETGHDKGAVILLAQHFAKPPLRFQPDLGCLDLKLLF